MSLAQLAQLLPLPDEDLQQALDYAATLSKEDAVTHFSNMLGDSPLAVDFIASFNAKRQPPKPVAAVPSRKPANTESLDAVPKTKRAPKKPKAPLHTPQARQATSYAGPAGTVYNRKDYEDYGYTSQPKKTTASSSNSTPRSGTPAAPAAKPIVVEPAPKHAPKQHASSAGFLIADALSKPKSKSNPTSRSSTPKPSSTSTKISISGGTPMAGQSTALADLEAAIRTLETSTNPTLDNPKARRCNCVATRHPLQSAAPNCLSCGKVICMKEGLGPCTFCGTALLSSDEVQAMVRQLKDDRGKERMAANAAQNRRAEISQKPAPFSQNKVTAAPSTDPSLSEAADKARQHRDKLLNFQAENAQRTTVRDEAADFDVSVAVSGSSGNLWSTPEERARELKRQQKLLREMEWNARPEYEKRQQVISIDIVKGKVVRKIAPASRPRTPDSEEDEQPGPVFAETSGNPKKTGGAYSGNPLLGSVMKPVFVAEADAVGRDSQTARKTRWRRVQDNLEDNEDLILDGGLCGHSIETSGGDEPECG
ncbi:hypothetical protein VHEMI05520 [[Torrubiella] hemipterigena]|uniref:TRIP4/RQT4 C2HC5-type zinc finger domain-containing protein n=1 Tax=[Torrubiella] hemipterigena TaxID=1531966 RepID=A0A0A1T4I2_9HYPO|nr:hypothetical protein VHEMI05520 [[Torrubiella] hemipterigena]